MIYEIRDIKENRAIDFKTINAMEELVFASYESERVYKIFNNEDDTFKVKTTGSYYMNKIAEISLDELPVVLSVFRKMDCEISNEQGGLNDSYIIKSDKKIFKNKELNYKYMYILPSFNDHKMIMFLSNDDETYETLKEANKNA